MLSRTTIKGNFKVFHALQTMVKNLVPESWELYMGNIQNGKIEEITVWARVSLNLFILLLGHPSTMLTGGWYTFFTRKINSWVDFVCCSQDYCARK